MLTKEETAQILLKIHAVLFRPADPFKYESGMLSPIYIDCRILPSFPDESDAIANALVHPFRQAGATVDVVVGTGASAIPLATQVSRRLSLPMAYVRPAPKHHGLRKHIEGASVAGKRILLVSDIISTGRDIPTSLEALRDAGGSIVHCRSVFDMQLAENDRLLLEAGIAYDSLTDLDTLLIIGVAERKLADTDRHIVREWRRSPAEWDATRRARLRETLEDNRRSVAKILLRTQAVRIAVAPPFFQYSSRDPEDGRKRVGPIYTDNRVLLAHPQDCATVVNTLFDLVVQNVGIQNIEAVAGIESSGVPYAVGLAERMRLPMLVVKGVAPEHGLRRQIDGRIQAGERVLVIEDLVNTGRSTLMAVEALRQAGALVSTCLAVFSYGFAAPESWKGEYRLDLMAVTDLASLLNIGVAENVVTPTEQACVLDWQRDPKGWSAAKLAPSI